MTSEPWIWFLPEGDHMAGESYIEFDIEQDDPQRPGQINIRVTNPTDDPKYVDKLVYAVGYGIYLRGFHLYVTGLDLPVFVPDTQVFLGPASWNRISDRTFDDRTKADSAIASAPSTNGSRPYAYYWGAGGALVVPTAFSPASAPRTVATMSMAMQTLAQEVQRDLTVLAISIVGGIVLRQILTKILRVGEGAGARPQMPSVQRIRPLNGTINVGGGFEAGSEAVTNLNPIVEGTGGPGANSTIANHIKAGFEDMGDVFVPRSANKIISNRLPFDTVDWSKAARGAAQTMAPGGRLSLNVWTRNPQQVQAVIDAFTRAGFKNVVNASNLVGPGTLITGVL
jgi:hypothetical protein